MPLLKQKTPSDGDGCEWRLSELAFLLLTAITAILQIQAFWCEKQFLALSGRKETSREKRNAKYGFCWRSEILVLKKASKLNKLPALSRWHLLGYFLSFFSTVFLFFFLRASQVSESRWCGEHALIGEDLHSRASLKEGEERGEQQPQHVKGVGEEWTSVGWCPFHTSTETIPGWLGMPAERIHTYPQVPPL